MTEINTPRRLRRVAALAMAAALGCGDKSTPNVDEKTAFLKNDAEQVLRALEPYDPIFTINMEGYVRHIVIQPRNVPTSAMAEIGKLKRLDTLRLNNCTVTDEGLAQLKDLQELRSLLIVGTPISDEGLAHLTKLAGLRFLFLPHASNSRITPAGLEKLKRECPQLSIY
jgi:hypothetical protein